VLGAEGTIRSNPKLTVGALSTFWLFPKSHSTSKPLSHLSSLSCRKVAVRAQTNTIQSFCLDEPELALHDASEVAHVAEDKTCRQRTREQSHR
jgi:hypothetical protein